ncbi:hypothetical protein ACWD6P_04760 [Streptomyces sp. NPDC002446]
MRRLAVVVLGTVLLLGVSATPAQADETACLGGNVSALGIQADGLACLVLPL